MDIVVTLSKKRGGMAHLNEKIEAVEENYASWDSASSIMNNFTDEGKVFICCEGYVRGYFTVSEILEEGMYQSAKAIPYKTLDMLSAVGLPEGNTKRIVFHEWVYIEPIPMKSFMGARKRKFKYEEKY
jgi:hypothetical protein